jgi:hypothetical protein
VPKVPASSLAEFAVWWVLLSLLGICFVGTVDVAETSVMLGSALIASVASVVARRAQTVRFGWPRGTGRPALRALASVLPDAARLLRALPSARRSRSPSGIGHLRAVRIPPRGDEDDAAELTRRAVLTTLVSAPPGTYISGVASDGTTYVHELGGEAASVLGAEARE